MVSKACVELGGVELGTSRWDIEPADCSYCSCLQIGAKEVVINKGAKRGGLLVPVGMPLQRGGA